MSILYSLSLSSDSESQSNSDGDPSLSILPHFPSSPKQRQPAKHGTDAIAQEHLLRHFDEMYLQLMFLERSGLATFSIIIGTSLSLDNFRSKSVGGGS